MANSYLQRTPSGAGNRRTFTISAWVKRSKLSDTTSIFSAHSADSVAGHFVFRVTNHDRIGWSRWSEDSYSTRLIRDPNAWYHFVLAVDTTQATASNRIKLYVNGVQETSFATGPNYPNQNTDLPVNNTNKQVIGANGHSSTSNYWDGYLSHVAVVDGQALTPTSFGETDSTSGIWKFKSPSGLSWGTNGFHLKFENSGNLGLDSSGQTNNFTVNGNLKQAVDTPSNNHATLNYLNNTNSIFTVTNGNNKATCTTSWNSGSSTLGMISGKWYWEAKYEQKGQLGAGIAQESSIGTKTASTLNTRASDLANAYEILSDGQKYSLTGNGGGSGASYASTINNGDIVMFAFDATNGALWAGINGAWANSATKTEIENGTVTNAMYSSIPGANDKTWFCTTSIEASGGGSTHGIVSFNFGNGTFGTTAITSAGSNGNGSLFEYDVPSGYYALNTKNINTYG
jgi:hypothetical protein